MSLISRVTTWTIGQVLKAADLNGEFNNITNLLNNLDAATNAWTNVKTGALTVTGTPTFSNNLLAYRRPVLQYSSGTVVNLETGLTGTSGQAQILFPDGNIRQDSTAGRINCNLAQNSATSGSAQSGLRTGSQTANTWYAIYAVKVTDSNSNFVTIADTVLPIQANYATLNSNFGTNGWTYLGLVRNGDQGGSTTVIIPFVQAGNRTQFNNKFSSANLNVPNNNITGVLFATSASTNTLTWNYASGTSGQVLPNNIAIASWLFNMANFTASLSTAGGAIYQKVITGGNSAYLVPNMQASDGVQITGGASNAMDILLTGWTDGALGIGANPLL